MLQYRPSWWDQSVLLKPFDFAVLGAGLIGKQIAIKLKQKYPKARVAMLDRLPIPYGASTRNAGFACFGSLSEIIDDLKSHSEEEVINLIQKRWEGLKLLRKRIGDEKLDFKPFGGYELFLKEHESDYLECINKLPFINEILQPLFKADVYSKEIDRFGFNGIEPALAVHTAVHDARVAQHR